MFKNRSYSLRKARHLLKNCYSWYKKHGNTLTDPLRTSFESQMEQLDLALLAKDKEKANVGAKKLDTFFQSHAKTHPWSFLTELGLALIIAFAIAVVVRAMWFEIYEIPTGSMRPSFKERDHLTVSKTAFGLNVPLLTDHFYFDPDLVERAKVVIFSADKLPVEDPYASYFGVLPYTKRYIKRMIGKPGDSLYFYGGKLYGVDQNGEPLKELLNDPYMQNLEHIPFLQFEKASSPRGGEIVFTLMNQEIGRSKVEGKRKYNSEVFDGNKWVKEDPLAQGKQHSSIQTYSDIWGIRNFAMARLLTKEEAKRFSHADTSQLEDAPLYLELRHSPNLTNPIPEYVGIGRKQEIRLTPFTTLIPLQRENLNALMNSMYTARFVVENQRARGYGSPHFYTSSPIFHNVPDGMYEFYNGKAYEIKWGGTAFELPKDHPLYNRSPENIEKLFNVGINMTDVVQPYDKNQPHYPSRYAYFREGDLYLLGSPVLKKEDPTLIAFNQNQEKLAAKSTALKPVLPFKDFGPPLKEDGELDVEFIRNFGVKVPEKHYLVLGDNHAMSSDSRVFGFIPEANLQGVPSVILWPFGDRWGFPQSSHYPFLTLPRLIVWAIAGILFIVWYTLHRRALKRPIYYKIDKK